MIARRGFATFTRVLHSNKKSSLEGANEGVVKKSSKPKQTKVESKQEKVVEQPKEEFRNDQYNSPEYFQHNKYTYVDFMVSMASQRLPQLSNQVPFKS